MAWLSLKVQDSPKARVLISVPKKVVSSAVKRNRMRRLIREAVRLDSYFSAPKEFLLKVSREQPDLKRQDVSIVLERLKKAAKA